MTFVGAACPSGRLDVALLLNQADLCYSASATNKAAQPSMGRAVPSQVS